MRALSLVPTWILFVSIMYSAAHAGTVTWDGDGDGSSWHDALNWSGDALPGGADDVLIDIAGTLTVTHSSGTTNISSLTCNEMLVLSGGTLAISGTSVISDYSQTGGTLGGTGDIEVTGPMSWTGGTIVGTVGSELIEATSAIHDFNIGGTSGKTLTGRTLRYTGALNWTDGNITVFSDATIEIDGADVFNANADGHSIAAGAGSIVNDGLFIVDVPSTLTLTGNSLSFVNNATLSIVSGTLDLSGSSDSTHTGATLTVAPGAVLDFSSGTHDLDDATTYDTDTGLFSGGTVNLDGEYNLAPGGSTTVIGGTVNLTGNVPGDLGDVALSSGTLNLANTEGSSTADSYDQSSGTLTGTSDLTVTGSATWNGGTISGTNGGEFFDANSAGDDLNLGGTSGKTLTGRTLRYTGALNWTDGNITVFSDATIEIDGADVFNANADGHSIAAGAGSIVNDGLFIVDVPSTLTLTGNSLSFVNNATLSIVSGTLDLSGSSDSTHTGATLTVAPGAVLDFSSGTHDLDDATTYDTDTGLFSGGTVNLDGEYNLAPGGSTTVIGGTVNLTGNVPGDLGDVALSSGTLNLANTEGSSTADSYDQSSGTLTGTSDLTVTGSATWNGGTISGTNGGEFFDANSAGDDLNLGGTSGKTLTGRTLRYTGALNWTDGNITVFSDATIEIDGADVFNANADGHSVAAGAGSLENAGTLNVSVPSTLTFTGNNLALLNSGTITIVAGQLQLTSNADFVQTAGLTQLSGGTISSTTHLAIQGGQLSGTGTVSADVLSDGGLVAPGGPIGTLVIDGDYTQSPASTLAIDIGGTTPDVEHDVLAVSGSVTLDGTLGMTLQNGHVPTLLETYECLSYASRSGVFCSFSGLEIPGDLYFSPVYDPTSLILDVVATPPPADCNGNGITDACEIAIADCNSNGIPDDCDVDAGAADCNANDVPDSCEILIADCNSNGIPDDCDVSAGAADCDSNGIPDTCDAFGCCGPAVGQCGNTDEDTCATLGGTWLGESCMTCPSQSVAIINEPGGSIFVHVIGPPVDCGGGGPPPAPCPPDTYLDAWRSPANGLACQNFGVQGSPAIPADFFDPGSDPFTDSICLQGQPLGSTPFGDFGDADTLIRRTAEPFDRCGLPDGGEVTIDLEIVALSLTGTAPLTVTHNGGQNPEEWTVDVDLSAVQPTPGMLTVTKSHCNGGTYTSSLNVQARFTFTKVVDPGAVRVLDTGLAGIEPVTLEQDIPAPWVHDVGAPFDEDVDACSVFHAGFDEIAPVLACDCNSNNQRDRCDVEDGSSLDCNSNFTPDECDIASGFSMDVDLNGIPDECEPGTCVDAASCCDVNGDGTRDALCTWCACPLDGTCQITQKIIPADIGGAFGVCETDTFCNVHDRTHALTCFSGTNPCASINIDAGGAFGACALDGFCNIHDANHALTCFAGTNTCACGPAPESPVEVVGGSHLRVVLSKRTTAPGQRLMARVFADAELHKLQSYQLDVEVSGGSSGSLKLERILVEDRADDAFGLAQSEFAATNTITGQMLRGLEETPQSAAPGAYLATFVYQVSSDASGDFVIDVAAGPDGHSALISDRTRKIEILGTTPATIRVQTKSDRR
jgi:hypothetical protein